VESKTTDLTHEASINDGACGSDEEDEEINVQKERWKAETETPDLTNEVTENDGTGTDAP
jgi:hypothetical protein